MDSENKGSQLISVITIFFNSQRHIEEAVESVLAQTYTNWELLLVDDGSTDKTSQEADRAADNATLQATISA